MCCIYARVCDTHTHTHKHTHTHTIHDRNDSPKRSQPFAPFCQRSDSCSSRRGSLEAQCGSSCRLSFTSLKRTTRTWCLCVAQTTPSIVSDPSHRACASLVFNAFSSRTSTLRIVVLPSCSMCLAHVQVRSVLLCAPCGTLYVVVLLTTPCIAALLLIACL
jgi:hypothetical protein